MHHKLQDHFGSASGTTCRAWMGLVKLIQEEKLSVVTGRPAESR